jgi:hypothetical protein
MRISIVSTNRRRCPHIVVEWEIFCDQKVSMATGNLGVVSNLEINSIAEEFRRISPISLDTPGGNSTPLPLDNERK